MFQIDTIHYITMLRDLLLPDSEREMKYQVDSLMGKRYQDGNVKCDALLITIDLSMKDWVNGKDFGRRCNLHILLCGYSSAFMAETDMVERPGPTPVRTEKPDREKGLDDTWRNVSNHSSCWKDAINDEINRIYFRWSREILARSGSGKAPKDLSHAANIHGLGAGVWKGKVVLRRDENNGYPGGYGVVGLSDMKNLG